MRCLLLLCTFLVIYGEGVLGADSFVVDYVHGPPTLGGSLSIFGHGWTEDTVQQLSAVVDGKNPCTLAFVAENELSCAGVGAGTGAIHVVAISNSLTQELVESSWAFADPIVSDISPRTGSTHANGEAMTIYGSNFGTQMAVKVHVGPYPATGCSAYTDDMIVCESRADGFGSGLYIAVEVDGVEGISDEPLFSFDEPVIDSVHSEDVAGSTEVRHTIVGRNLGPQMKNGDRNVMVNGQECHNVRVIKDHLQLECFAPQSGKHDSSPTMVQVTGLEAHRLARFRKPHIYHLHPDHGRTEGDFDITIRGRDFGPTGSSIEVTIGSVRARNCHVFRHHKIVCSVPQGVGKRLDLSVSRHDRVAIKKGAFSYDTPRVHSADSAPTTGGHIVIHGSNFGPIGTPLAVTIGGRPCRVRSSEHHSIECIVMPGTGKDHRVEVSYRVGGRVVNSHDNEKFSYYEPVVTSVLPVKAQGGRTVIVGDNFGTDASLIKVWVGDDRCDNLELEEAHHRIACDARAHTPGAKKLVTVKVDSLDSSHHDHNDAARLQYTNQKPHFDAHSAHFEVAEGHTMMVTLPASDPDGDMLKFDVKGLPSSAEWTQSGNKLKIQYTPSSRKESSALQHSFPVEVLVTDGYDYDYTRFDIMVKSCPEGYDTCRDKTCVPAESVCPFCPVSDLPRCPISSPLLLVADGSCHGFDVAMQSDRLVAGPAQHVGVTVDSGIGATIPILTQDMAHAGFLDFDSKGTSPMGKSDSDLLVCMEVLAHPAHHPALASPAVQISAGSKSKFFLRGRLALVPFDQGMEVISRYEDPDQNDERMGRQAYYDYHIPLDARDYCLGRLTPCKGPLCTESWTCVDEHLEWAYGYLQGVIVEDGIYALLHDNCPEHSNPDQRDTNMDGVGDVCSSISCIECNSRHLVNSNFVRSALREIKSNEKYMCKPTRFSPEECSPNYVSNEVPPVAFNPVEM